MNKTLALSIFVDLYLKLLSSIFAFDLRWDEGDKMTYRIGRETFKKYKCNCSVNNLFTYLCIKVFKVIIKVVINFGQVTFRR